MLKCPQGVGASMQNETELISPEGVIFSCLLSPDGVKLYSWYVSEGVDEAILVSYESRGLLC